MINISLYTSLTAFYYYRLFIFSHSLISEITSWQFSFRQNIFLMEIFKNKRLNYSVRRRMPKSKGSFYSTELFFFPLSFHISQYLRSCALYRKPYSALWWWWVHTTHLLFKKGANQRAAPGTCSVQSRGTKHINVEIKRNTPLSVHCFKSVQYIHRTKIIIIIITKRTASWENNCNGEKKNPLNNLDSRSIHHRKKKERSRRCFKTVTWIINTSATSRA